MAGRAGRHRAMSAVPAGARVAPVVLVVPATSADPADPATSAGPAARVGHHPEISTARVTMIGDRRGTRRTTTGAGGSAERRGATGHRRGAWGRRHHRHGTDRCRRRGVRRHRPSTTSVSKSSRFGIPAITSGASGSSESGFRCLYNESPADGRLGSSPRRSSTLQRREYRMGRCLSPPTNVVATCCGSPANSTDSSRGNSSVKKLFTSMRASAAPRQKWTP